MMELIFGYVNKAFGTFFNFDTRIALVYLAATVVLAFGIWVWRGRQTNFIRFLLPKEVYFHRSNLLDIKIFLFNLVLGVTGAFGAIVFTPLITIALLGAMVNATGGIYEPIEMTWTRSLMATVIMVLAMDFCKYWAHYIHHEWKALWPFHSVHHSAEVMTPLTAYRNHPVFLIIRSAIYSLVLGSVQALALFLLIGEIDLLTIGGANAGYFIFNLVGSNLRHSHIWLSYGRVMEHILISPAQHQVHHSIDVKHHDKNYGEVFAFWDWMFGTLYVPNEHEKLTFGVADENGVPQEQPHPTLRAALFHPFVESWEALFVDQNAKPEDTTPQETA
jgi:sterol desaturase/sphingolipid hydroxylase (fatty acid hydroxylase superfamily)